MGSASDWPIRWAFMEPRWKRSCWSDICQFFTFQQFVYHRHSRAYTLHWFWGATEWLASITPFVSDVGIGFERAEKSGDETPTDMIQFIPWRDVSQAESIDPSSETGKNTSLMFEMDMELRCPPDRLRLQFGNAKPTRIIQNLWDAFWDDRSTDYTDQVDLSIWRWFPLLAWPLPRLVCWHSREVIWSQKFMSFCAGVPPHQKWWRRQGIHLPCSQISTTEASPHNSFGEVHFLLSTLLLTGMSSVCCFLCHWSNGTSQRTNRLLEAA